MNNAIKLLAVTVSVQGVMLNLNQAAATVDTTTVTPTSPTVHAQIVLTGTMPFDLTLDPNIMVIDAIAPAADDATDATNDGTLAELYDFEDLME